MEGRENRREKDGRIIERERREETVLLRKGD